MANGWTKERRQRQSELIQSWKPWARSTGPRTSAGKAKVSQNANKGYDWLAIRNTTKALTRNKKALDAMADTVVDAALDGELRAIREIARVLDE